MQGTKVLAIWDQTYYYIIIIMTIVITSCGTRALHGLSTLRISDFRSSFGARARVALALLQPCSLAFLKAIV